MARPRSLLLIFASLLGVVAWQAWAHRAAQAAEGTRDRQPQRGQAATRDRVGPDGIPIVELANLYREPSSRLREKVRFTLQFKERQPDWNPYVTRFGPGDFAGIAAWGDEEFLWEQAVWDAPYRTLFARQNSPAAASLALARVYERLEVVAFVREVFLDQPWIEIVEVQPQTLQVGEGTVLHVTRALQLFQDGQFELAGTQLERAKGAPMPEHALAEIDRLIELCRQAQERAKAK